MKSSILLLCAILTRHIGESGLVPVALVDKSNTIFDENLQQVCVGEERYIANHAEGSAEFKIYFAAMPLTKTMPQEIAPNTKCDEDKGEKKKYFASKIFGGKGSQESPTEELPAERPATEEEVKEQTRRNNEKFENFINDCKNIKTKNTVGGKLFLAVQIADRWQILDSDELKLEGVHGMDEVGKRTVSATYKRRFFNIDASGDPSQQVDTLANIDKPEVEDSCLPYEVTTPSLTKMATKQTFHYMRLGLKYVTDCFKYKIEWNKNYKPAQKIFGGGLKSTCIQTGIKVINMYSYSTRPFRPGGHKSGYLESNPTQFFQFLKDFANVFSNDKDKDNKVEKMRRYTYVIVENMICFAETGSDTAEDFASKHAILARGAENVYYAGEFWWTFDEKTQKGTLYMDNNSGTYSPPQADLFRPKILMEFNIPGIEVVVLEQNTPEWKEAREKAGLI